MINYLFFHATKETFLHLFSNKLKLKAMIRKRIPRKYRDLIHLALFLIVLVLFANYEANRKTAITSTYTSSQSDTPSHAQIYATPGTPTGSVRTAAW